MYVEEDDQRVYYYHRQICLHVGATMSSSSVSEQPSSKRLHFGKHILNGNICSYCSLSSCTI